MSVVSYQGGPITHKYLMRKTRFELLRLLEEYERMTHTSSLDVVTRGQYSKSQICTRIIDLLEELPRT